MALLDQTKTFVGIQRRLDGNVRHPGYYPRAYVRMDLGDYVVNMSADTARQLAKVLVANANLIDPPKPRVKRS